MERGDNMIEYLLDINNWDILFLITMGLTILLVVGFSVLAIFRLNGRYIIHLIVALFLVWNVACAWFYNSWATNYKEARFGRLQPTSVEEYVYVPDASKQKVLQDLRDNQDVIEGSDWGRTGIRYNFHAPDDMGKVPIHLLMYVHRSSNPYSVKIIRKTGYYELAFCPDFTYNHITITDRRSGKLLKEYKY